MKPIDQWSENYQELVDDIECHIRTLFNTTPDQTYKTRRLIMLSIREHIKDDLKAGVDINMEGINNER